MSDNPPPLPTPQGPIDWTAWEAVIRTNGVTVDRPRHSVHPVWASIIYPLDYGYANDTMSTDDEEMDVFVGTADSGLVGAIFTTDHRKGDKECKFLVDCTPEEVYAAVGFLNFDRALMDGDVVLRDSMQLLWQRVHAVQGYVPIDCGFYDRLEHWAVRKETCRIGFTDGSELEARFTDFDNRGEDGEFAVLSTGRRVRLDHIAHVNGVPRPGATDSCATSTS
ncbi:MAG: hypothetical protein JJ896_15705 [Rhodothermales bacterium]|nr:hypothetical protein [Rhodothermales bacterium]MBO6781101.1 hypothetical protein [Rhodothermales bacterium]